MGRVTTAGDLRIDVHVEGERSLPDDVLDGLTRPFKEIPPKHLYDTRGSELFGQICDLPEYSTPFYGTEFKVLRGGSWATRPRVARNTFRNWDSRLKRQIFAGFRCARDAARS